MCDFKLNLWLNISHLKDIFLSWTCEITVFRFCSKINTTYQGLLRTTWILTVWQKLSPQVPCVVLGLLWTLCPSTARGCKSLIWGLKPHMAPEDLVFVIGSKFMWLVRDLDRGSIDFATKRKNSDGISWNFSRDYTFKHLMQSCFFHIVSRPKKFDPNVKI